MPIQNVGCNRRGCGKRNAILVPDGRAAPEGERKRRSGLQDCFRTAALVTSVLGGSGVLAGAARADDWQHRVTTYLLVPWIDTTVTTNSGATTQASADPGDIFSALDFGFMLAGESRKGKFSLLYDVMYSNIGESGTLSGPIGATVDVGNKMLFATMAAGYDVYQQDNQFVQIFGGARYVDFEAAVSAVGGGPIGVTVGANVSKDWVEPVIGIRGRTAINDKLTLGGYANAGGFGVGSELTFDLYGGLDYAISDRMSASWRAGDRRSARQSGFRLVPTRPSATDTETA